MAPNPMRKRRPIPTCAGWERPTAAPLKSDSCRDAIRVPRIAIARTSATAPTSSSASMKRTVRPRDGSRFSQRIITAPPKLISSHAIKQRRAVLKSEHAESPKKAHCGSEQPAARAAPRRRGERASESRRQEPEAHKPKAFRINAEGDRFTSERVWKDDRRTSGWQADDRRQNTRRNSHDEENPAQH